ncbi:MAG: hypothetical protein D6701_05405 [Gemmatimonadetes bacterium]|nr:MAG: hypothetical protein D6701_05405 [Gemmatimonadota bacterium]
MFDPDRPARAPRPSLSPLRCGVLVAAALSSLTSFVGPRPALGQEPLLEALRARTSSEAVTLGMLLQVVGSLGLEDDPGTPDRFEVANARLSLRGRLDGGWSYFVQTAFTSSPALLDLRIAYAPAGSPVTVSVGRFKTPLSREFLTAASAIDFVDRSRVVRAFAPGRQVGAAVELTAADGWRLSTGLFSGADQNHSASRALGLLRLEREQMSVAGGRLSVGASAAFGDDGAVLPRGVEGGFAGSGRIFQGDLRWTRGLWLVASDVLSGRFDPAEPGAPTRTGRGGHITVGLPVSERSQALVRVDRIEPLGGPTSDLIVLGWNVWPTAATEVQINWLAPLDEHAGRHRLVVNVQIGF